MARGLTWVFTLVDNMSKTADDIASSVNKLMTSLKGVNGVASTAASGVKSLKTELAGVGKDLSKVIAASEKAQKFRRPPLYRSSPGMITPYADLKDVGGMRSAAARVNEQITAQKKLEGYMEQSSAKQIRQASQRDAFLVTQAEQAAKRKASADYRESVRFGKKSQFGPDIWKQTPKLAEASRLAWQQRNPRRMTSWMHNDAFGTADNPGRLRQQFREGKAAWDIKAAALAASERVKESAAFARKEGILHRIRTLQDSIGASQRKTAISAGVYSAKLNEVNAALARAKRTGDSIASRAARISPLKHLVNKGQDFLSNTFSFKGGEGGLSRFMEKAFFTFSSIRMAYSGLQSVLSAPMAVGGVAIEAAAFKQKSVAVLDTVLSSEDKEEFGGSDKILKDMRLFAEKLRVPVQDVKALSIQLLASKFKLSETPIAVQALSDLATVTEESPREVYSRATLALSQIKGRPALGMQEVRQFTELSAQGGIGQIDIFNSIAKRIPGKGGKPMTGKELMSKLDEGGRIESQLAVYGMFDAIIERLGGPDKKAGNLTKKLSNTIPRQFELLKGRPMTLLEDVGDTAGLASFSSMLENVISLTSRETEQGRELQRVMNQSVGNVFEGIFGSFAGEDGKSKLLSLFTWILSSADSLYGLLKPIGTVLYDAFVIVSPPLLAIGAGVLALLPLIGAVAEGFLSVWALVSFIVTPFLRMLSTLIAIVATTKTLQFVMKLIGFFLGIIAVMMTYTAIMSAIAFAPFTVAFFALVAIVALVEALITKIAKAGSVSGAFADIWKGIKNFFTGETEVPQPPVPAASEWTPTSWMQLGKDSGMGYNNGLMSTTAPAYSTGELFGMSAIAGASNILETRSPSRAFRRLGKYTADGFIQGVRGKEDDVQASYQDVYKPALEGGVQRGGKNGGVRDITVQISMKEGVTDAETFLKQLRLHLPAALTESLEEVGLEMGVT